MSPKELYEWALNYKLLTMEDLGISKHMNGSPETVLLNLNKGM